jgi:hypothetical protein
LLGHEIVVGRGSTGHVTIDDPMLSRRHIRIDLSGTEPILEDLESRNGTQLNGRPVEGPTPLEDGDRIRIGTQELVFLAPDSAKKDDRRTSALKFCASCAIPYPSRGPRCPHCGAVPGEADSGAPARDSAPSGWTFHLLSQVVGRAVEQGRLTDAERMMSRGVAELEAQLNDGIEVEPARILGIAECSARLGCALRGARWIEIGARLYGRAGEPPSREVLALLDGLPEDRTLEGAIALLRHAGSGTRRAS